jgi:hypothetical protein
MSDLECPRCGRSVPDLDPGGETGWEGGGSVRPHQATCDCGAVLLRNPEVAELRQWRVDDLDADVKPDASE